MSSKYAKNEDQFENNPPSKYSPFVDHLAPEMIVAIFERLQNWEDILNGQKCCKKLRKILRSNSQKLARPPVDLKITKNIEGWKLEMERKLDGKGRIEKNLAPLDWFEVENLKIIGPMEDLEFLGGKLKTGRQKRIQSIFMENVNFKNCDQIANWLFVEQKKCQKIHLKNCRGFGHFVQLLGNQIDVNWMESLGQFKFENEFGEEEMGGPFSELVLAKFGWDLRFRMRPHPMPFLWDAPLPNDGQIPKSFLAALCKFIENWVFNSDAPHFHISIRNCPPHFCGQFTEKCANFGISQIFMQFSSRAHYCAQIKGKYNRENRTFELFPIRDVPTRANAIFLARFFRDI